MARFYGNVGYGKTVDKGSGVWADIITEFPRYGDVLRNTRRNQEGQSTNDDVLLNNSISFVATDYDFANYTAIRYVVWNGGRWAVSNIEVQRPRLILTLGGVYNGPLPAPDTP